MKRVFLLVFLFLFSVEGFTQDKEEYSGLFKNVLFCNFINQIEQTDQFKVFYPPQYDSVQISLEYKNIKLDSLAHLLEHQLGCYFLIVEPKTLIASENYRIKKSILPNVFTKETIMSKPGGKSMLASIREQEATEREKAIISTVFEVGDVNKRFDGEKAILSGYIKEAKTGEPVVGASVFRKSPLIGVTTDPFGYYSIILNKGRVDIYVNSIGMKPAKRQIDLHSDGELNIELQDALISLKEVVVTAEKSEVDGLQTGFANLNIKTIKQMPTAMGEADIMKIALAIPGVQSVGEGSSGFNVRGGSADQNLVLLNDVPVYNTNHLFGFISVFNPSVLSGANLYKSGIGAQYGGRVSSVFDVSIKDGNKKKFGLRGGISPVTTNLMVEGPLKKDTSSYVVGVRTTYSDWVFSLLDNPTLRNSKASFYDVLGKINHRINKRNELVFSSYFSEDKFKLNTDSLYQYASGNANLIWRHTFSNKLNAVNSIAFANYNYSLTSEKSPINAFELNYQINHYSIKSEFNYLTENSILLKAGVSSILYKLNPGTKSPLGSSSIVQKQNLLPEQGLESVLYMGGEYELNDKIKTYAGVRFALFNGLGPGLVYNYLPSTPKEEEFIKDSVLYASNSIIKTYLSPDVRVSARYKVRDDISLKFSYDRTTQFIHMLSNTVSFSPTDTWRLSGESIKPEFGNQLSVGLYKTFFGTSLTMSFEGYYKLTNNVLAYKDGAELLLNDKLETDVIPAKGKSYGIEFLLKKNSGKFTGWFSYTYSRSLLQANGEFASERINNGEFYPSNYDKPHSIVVITNYKFNRRLNISANFNYSSGRPATFPLAKYKLRNQLVLLYTNRNEYRIPDYIRVDLSVNIEGNHKVHKKIHGSWSFSVYNLLGRANAYSVFFKNEGGNINGYKLTVFKTAIPTITYNFRLQ